jgi:hypothetical protein
MTIRGRSRIDWDFTFHPPGDDARALHELVRAHCRDLARTLDQVLPQGREASLALTRLEEAMFWANAAIARQDEGS